MEYPHLWKPPPGFSGFNGAASWMLLFSVKSTLPQKISRCREATGDTVHGYGSKFVYIIGWLWNTCMYISMCIYIYIYVCIYIYICMYVCMYACMYVCMYVYHPTCGSPAILPKPKSCHGTCGLRTPQPCGKRTSPFLQSTCNRVLWVKPGSVGLWYAIIGYNHFK